MEKKNNFSLKFFELATEKLAALQMLRDLIPHMILSFFVSVANDRRQEFHSQNSIYKEI